MALGAGRRQILWMVLRESLALVGVGAALGLAMAFTATRFISSQFELYGVKPTDPVTMAAATTALVAVAVFAGYIPARRATKVDPMVALRYE
jgi:ABC-type antimicrobial peptide transport system permease subunit